MCNTFIFSHFLTVLSFLVYFVLAKVATYGIGRHCSFLLLHSGGATGSFWSGQHDMYAMSLYNIQGT